MIHLNAFSGTEKLQCHCNANHTQAVCNTNDGHHAVLLIGPGFNAKKEYSAHNLHTDFNSYSIHHNTPIEGNVILDGRQLDRASTALGCGICFCGTSPNVFPRCLADEIKFSYPPWIALIEFFPIYLTVELKTRPCRDRIRARAHTYTQDY